MATFCAQVEKICVQRGDSPVIFVEFKDENDALIDITGWTGQLTVSEEELPSAANNLFQVNGIVPDQTANNGADLGVMTFQPTETDTDQAPGTPRFYDIQVIIPGSPASKRTKLKGEFEIEQDINKG